MSDDAIRVAVSVISSVILFVAGYMLGRIRGNRESVGVWKPVTEDLSKSVSRLVDTYGPLLRDYKSLLEAYRTAYDMLERNGLLDGDGE